MEKYSVLMSLYKKENPDYLKEALNSMINQTIKPDEIVLVEDGPLTDELIHVVDSYCRHYPQLIHLIVNETNLGLGLALNRGLKACKNELVARMDTDDISISDRCEKQLKYFELHPETTILGGQIDEFIDTTEEVVGRRVVPESDKELKLFLKKRCPFNHMTVMFRKDAVLNAGNYQEWFWNEDYYLWIRLALQEAVFANLPDTLVYARVGVDMYKRRGGLKYFKSEVGIQNLMLQKKLISLWTYLINCGKRMIAEVLIPNNLRGWFYKTFVRE